MKLTRIQHRTSVDRVRLYVDDEADPRLEIAVDLLLRSGLASGDTLTAGRLEALRQEDEAYRARAAALSLLAHRARTREELRRRLGRKEFTVAAIEDVLAWLDERGYLDDRAFAEAFVRDRLRLRPRGRLALIRELGGKGVDASTAEAAIDEVMAAEAVDDRDVALEAAEAWARKNRSLLGRAARSAEDRRTARRRLYGHLARRGFTGDAVRSAIAAVLDD